MARYLITQSLLSSWNYVFDCFEGYEDEAREEFMQTLRREKGEQSEAMLKGIAFENLCYSIADGSFRPGHEFAGPCNPNTGELMERQVYPFGYQGACFPYTTLFRSIRAHARLPSTSRTRRFRSDRSARLPSVEWTSSCTAFLMPSKQARSTM